MKCILLAAWYTKPWCWSNKSGLKRESARKARKKGARKSSASVSINCEHERGLAENDNASWSEATKDKETKKRKKYPKNRTIDAKDKCWIIVLTDTSLLRLLVMISLFLVGRSSWYVSFERTTSFINSKESRKKRSEKKKMFLEGSDCNISSPRWRKLLLAVHV